MTAPFSETTTFILDRPHLTECFEQSAPPIELKDYRKAAIFAVMGIALMFVESEDYYVAFFLLALGMVELLGIRYKKVWWLWRQLLGKSSYSKITLTIDEQGLKTESLHVNNLVLWSDVISCEKTELGLLLRHNSGVNYLSRSYLSNEAIEFILKNKPIAR